MGYAYRVDGPQDLHGAGHRFNPNKVLIDPYGRGTTSTLWDRVAACGPDDNLAQSLRSVVIDMTDYDWEGDQPLRRPMQDTVIYEMHVRGFTKSPTSGVAHPGTYLGVIEKIPYLRSLGVTAVELMPVFEFDEDEISGTNPLTGQRLINYWGYNPSASSPRTRATASRPTRARRSASSRTWSRPSTRPASRSSSTWSSTTPPKATTWARRSASRAWRTASTTCSSRRQAVLHELLRLRQHGQRQPPDRRDDHLRLPAASGSATSTSTASASTSRRSCRAVRTATRCPIRRSVESSSTTTLADTKIIAEAWDAGGLYQVGSFPDFRWAEWNGRYRDDVRRFVKGDDGHGLARSRPGSPAVPTSTRTTASCPINSINFITSHDGFTLNDLVSYNDKHNEANGEGNRDGRQQPQLQLRRRRRHGRRRDRGAARPPGPELPDDPAADPGRADDGHGRRGAPDAARQQQRLLPGQRDHLVRLGARRRARRPRPLHQRAHRLPQGACRRSAGRASSRARSTSAASPTSRGTAAASFAPGWDDPESRVLAFTLGGFPIRRAARSSRHRHPRHDEHGLERPGLRHPDGRGPALASRDRHRRASAGRHPSPRGTSRSARATPTASRTAASWCSSRSHDAGAASSVQRSIEEEPSWR